jgi:hypothetical protein
MQDATGLIGAQTATSTTHLVVKAPAPAQHGGFREFLSELNPLQYIPVLGTIYRAVTGDTIPETARDAGSLVVSGLTGGPIGVAVNLATLAAEKVTGIDPEKLGGDILAGIGIGGGSAASPSMPVLPETPAPPARHEPVHAKAWSPAQLTAYGIQTNAMGDLERGAVAGSDVLNDLELARHSQEDIA